MVMDGLTRLYEQTVRLRAEPEQLATIRWYWAPRGAKPFPESHAFGSSGWETESRPYPHKGIGEVFLPRILIPDWAPLGQGGRGTPTPIEWFKWGVPKWVDGPFPVGVCSYVCGVGWRPLSLQVGAHIQRAAAAVGWRPAAWQVGAAAGFWWQRGSVGCGAIPAALQSGSGVQRGAVGVSWATQAVSAGAAFHAGAVGVGWAPQSGQRQPGSQWGTVGVGWAPAGAQEGRSRQAGAIAVGWAPQSTTRAAARQVGAASVGWAVQAPGRWALSGRGGAVADGAALFGHLGPLVASGGVVGDGSSNSVKAPTLAAKGGAVGNGKATIKAGATLSAKGGAVADGSSNSVKAPTRVAKGGAVGGGAAHTESNMQTLGMTLAFSMNSAGESTSSTVPTDLPTPDQVAFTLDAACDVGVEFTAVCNYSGPVNTMSSQLVYDGTPDGSGSGAVTPAAATYQECLTFMHKKSLAPGSHVIKVQHWVGAGTGTWARRALHVWKLT